MDPIGIVAKKKGRGELFDDQLTTGGSSVDLKDVDEALVRHHLGRRVRQLVKNDGQQEKRFNWNAAGKCLTVSPDLLTVVFH